MKGRDRNKPCWCGSDKKYKNCHFNRNNASKDSPWTAVEVNKKAFTKKKCFASRVGLGLCEGSVVKAHTVSRGPNLSKIAKNRHVLHYTASIPDMNENGGKLSLQKIGINEASVFFGFCAKHDREIFSCIENEPFIGDPKQCLTIAYRTLSRELYGKDSAAHMRETLRGADKGKPLLEQYILQAILDDINSGNEASRRELKATHKILTESLVNHQSHIISSIVFEFPTALPFMFAGAWSPLTDLYGKEIQKGYSNQILEQLFVSSFAGNENAMICFSWRDIDKAPGMVIAKQIKDLPTEKQTSACLQMVMKHVENIFFNPDWFQKKLTDKQRNILFKLASDGLDGSIPSEVIDLNMSFHLPQASRIF